MAAPAWKCGARLAISTRMTNMASIAELQLAGVTVEADEAVAIAQQLIDALCGGADDAHAQPPFGPLSVTRVWLHADGRVRCAGYDTTPAVSEVAILLQALLRPEPARLPGGLRYAIARALLDVDVPPFDSLQDFADTLTRYERGPRDAAVRRVLERLDTRRALAATVDRRRHPRETELRRALREADARLYMQKLAAGAVTVETQRLVGPLPLAAQRTRATPAATACVAAGLLLIVAGEALDRAVPSAAPPATTTAPAATQDIVLTAERPPSPAPPRARTRHAPRPAIKRVAAARPPAKRSADPTRSHSAASGMLDRLRLHWLKTVFASRAEGG